MTRPDPPLPSVVPLTIPVLTQTADPPPQLTVTLPPAPSPFPLPAGWLASLVRFDLDGSQAPPRRIATLQVTGPEGQTVQAKASCPDVQLWGMTPDQIALYMWPQVQGYVLAAIGDITAHSPVPPEAPNIDVPVVFV